MTNVKVQRKDVPTDQEIQEEINQADRIKNPYRKLRAKAIIGLLETGKRRSEIATLRLQPESDLWIDEKFLYVRFTVRKKRKKSENILQRVKKYNLESQYAIMIITYWNFIKEKLPKAKFLFPQGHCVFGQVYVFDFEKSVMPQEIWRVIKAVNPKDWPHLHRERRAVKVIRADEVKFGEAKLETVYRIKTRLDLEREQTAYNYIRRHETQKVEEDDEPF